MFVYNLLVLRLYMSSYGMCPYVFCILNSTRFGLNAVALL